MKNYLIIQRDGEKRTATVNGNTVTIRFDTNPDFYVQLEERDDIYLYRWNHLGGSGAVRIPSHIMLDLPELMTIMNLARDYRIFEPADIFDATPIAELFKVK